MSRVPKQKKKSLACGEAREGWLAFLVGTFSRLTGVDGGGGGGSLPARAVSFESGSAETSFACTINRFGADPT